MNLSLHAPSGVPEVTAGADLTELLLAVLTPIDGDIVTITSKVVSKAEGRAVSGDRATWVADQTERLVASRDSLRIVRNRLGLTMAAAGIDGSNVTAGTSLLLPVDPDASARRIRAEVADRTGATVAVLVTDTAGRAWRTGQTDIAIGAAGLHPLDDFAGRVDPHGNVLAVTAPAVADELASAAELASGKLGERPFVLIRGRSDLVLPAKEDGPGARTLVRAEGEDLFGYGAREAVVRAVRAGEGDAVPFGAAVPATALAEALERSGLGAATVVAADEVGIVTDRLEALAAIAFAHGWRCTATAGSARHQLFPAHP